MFEYTQEFINRATLDTIPKKIEIYKEEHKMFYYQFLYSSQLAKEIKELGLSVEPYYANEKDAAKSRMTHIKKGNRKEFTPIVVQLISENMGTSPGELLWGEEKYWQSLLPALFYVLLFDSLLADESKHALSFKAKTVLKDSVVFASELAKKETSADLSDGMIDFTIHDKGLVQAIYRLYQPKVQEKFSQLFKEEFIDSSYSPNKLKNKLILFARRVFDEVLPVHNVEQSSLGYQVYHTYDIFYSSETREYRSSIATQFDERFTDISKSHYLEKEQEEIVKAIDGFVEKLSEIQQLQDAHLGYRNNAEALFRKGFDMVGFDDAYFDDKLNGTEPELMIEGEMVDYVKHSEDELFD
ncbi:hypothetical protein STRDD10_01136 [Streptococcus sp. DD10]|uniref:hypothetical protein n=1 Tax=Streptococcus sp. DD10 TaxID=1777878 RepID=UPI000794648B|nr:hypothetical protein [Streptococcus sp. DD10]KXT74176.1 hypothetical protein STRDD10_01136 [Streptococcus sp. DD10]